MNPETFNAWRLVSLSPLPAWALGALLVAVALGVLLALFGVRREPARRRRYLLWGLRALAGVCAVFFLLEPGVRDLQVARLKGRVAVLVDRSASMGFPVAPGEGTRSAAVADVLDARRADLDALRERFQVDLLGFDPEVGPLSLEALRQEPPRAGRTDLLSALRTVRAQDSGGKKLSGVLLFTDGADNAELASGVQGRAREALGELGVPVSTFLVARESPRDLALEAVKVDDFAFVRNSLTVEVQLRGKGFSGVELPVVLKRDGQVVASKAVRLQSQDDTQTVSFTFTPDQTGRFVYTASVPVFPDEAVAENNTRSFALKVIRDRIRVLLVVGRPSWDERFLRGLLRQDPNIDLVSFYILRSMSDDPMVRNQERELSLIPFPMEEIFDAKLDTFDVVIFQNFGYTDPQLSIASYERNLERYIFNGGAFAVIGGDHAFGDGRTHFQKLAEALPVAPSGLPADPSEFRARVTTDGLRHPVTALTPSAQGTQTAWDALPALPGANLTVAKPGATVLLDHPFASVAGKNAPLLALWDYGRGRVLALATDASWYWAFTSHATGAPNRHYDTLWGNALRWLVRDPELTTLRVNADPPSVEPGKPVAAVVLARLPDYQPAADAEVKVELFSVETQKVIAAQLATTGPDGTARVEFPPPAPGAYKLLGSAKKGDQALGEGEDAVAVRAVGPELSDAAARPELLRDLAARTGGRAYELPVRSLRGVPLLDPPVVEVGRSKDRPLWDRWYFLVALVAVLGLEWGLRRRFGYV